MKKCVLLICLLLFLIPAVCAEPATVVRVEVPEILLAPSRLDDISSLGCPYQTESRADGTVFVYFSRSWSEEKSELWYWENSLTGGLTYMDLPRESVPAGFEQGWLETTWRLQGTMTPSSCALIFWNEDYSWRYDYSDGELDTFIYLGDSESYLYSADMDSWWLVNEKGELAEPMSRAPVSMTDIRLEVILTEAVDLRVPEPDPLDANGDGTLDLADIVVLLGAQRYDRAADLLRLLCGL